MGERQQRENNPCKDFGSAFYDAPVSLEYAREYQIKNNVRDDESRQRLLLPTLRDSMIKPLSSSIVVPIEALSSQIPIPGDLGLLRLLYGSRRPGYQHDRYLRQPFVSILSKEKWDLILFVTADRLYVNDGFEI